MKREPRRQLSIINLGLDECVPFLRDNMSNESSFQEAKMLPEQGGNKPTRKRRSQLKLRGKSWVIERSRYSCDMFHDPDRLQVNWALVHARLARRKVRNGKRDWAAMPGECLSLIFLKLGPINILLTAQFVCRSWQQAAHDPRSWRCADFTIWFCHVFHTDDDGFEDMVKAAVNRSRGLIEEFSLESSVEDETLLYMARRSSKLKRLRLDSINHKVAIKLFKLCPLLEDIKINNFCNSHWPRLQKRLHLNDDWFIARGEEMNNKRDSVEDDTSLYMVQRKLKRLRLGSINHKVLQMFELCPLLEDVELNTYRHCDNLFDDIRNSHWPPLLKRFHLNGDWFAATDKKINNTWALWIARNMPELRDLNLQGNRLSNEGLGAILDGCPHLESLNIGWCYNVDLGDEDIKKRCCKINNFLGPCGRL